jgi:hypothetical protein
MEDGAEIGLDVGSDEGGPVHDFGDFGEAFADFDAVEGGVDGGECAEDLVDGEAFLEWLIGFGVEHFGSGHATAHPEEDAAVGFGGGVFDGFFGAEAWRAGHECGEAGGGECLEEVAAAGGFRDVVRE